MNRRNTLNTRLLPLSILISSLVSGGAMAAAPILTKDSLPKPKVEVQTGDFTRVTDGGSFLLGGDNSAVQSVVDKNSAKNPIGSLLEEFIPAGQQITPEMIAELEANHEQQLKDFKAQISQLAAEKQKQAHKDLAIIRDAFAKKLMQAKATLAYAEDQSDENKNKLNEATKDSFIAHLNGKAPGQFTAEEAKALANAALTKDTSAISPALQQKLDAIKTQQAAIENINNKLQDYLNKGLITQAQKEKLEADFAEKQDKLEAQAAAKQAQEEAKKANNEAVSDELRLATQSVLANTKAENADKAKTDAEAELATLNGEKSDAIKAVDSTWDEKTLDIAKELQDLIDDPSTDSAKKAEAETAQKAIAKAEAANKLVKQATTEQTDAEKAAQEMAVQYTAAKKAKTDADAALADKTNELDAAVAEVAKLEKVTNPTTDTPVFEQIIAKGEAQNVSTDTAAFDSKVAGGTQTVAEKGKIMGSIVTEDGVIELEAGAQAIDTVITQGTMTNKGGTDTDTQVGAKGKLALAGADATQIAKSKNTKVSAGGEVTLGDHSEVGQMVTSGMVEASGSAQLIGTTIEAGELSIAEGAMSIGTTLKNGDFIINSGATANDTTLKGGQFNLMDQAKATKLLVENGYALIAGQLKDATFNGGKAIFGTTAEVSGTIDSGKDSLLSIYDGADTQGADLNLAGNIQFMTGIAPRAAVLRAAAMTNPAQFAFKNVTLNGGTVDMSSTNTQLTMESLAGDGTFVLAPSLYNQANAPLNVTGDATGNFGIKINDNGVAPTNLKIIDVKGVNAARFALTNGPVNLGNYKHTLVSDGQGGYKLVADTTTLTPSSAGVLAVANTLPVIFSAELSSIQNRLDKQTTSANESGMWINYLNDNFKVSGTAANFDQKLNGMTLGGDKAIDLGDVVLSVGGFGSYSNSDIKSDYQSSGSVRSHSLGAYAQYLTNNGYYLNGVLKANQFKQKLSVTSQGSSASGSANVSGLGVSVKAGKHINFDAMYVSPYAALSTFASGKSQYPLSNGMDAKNQGSRNTTGTLGVNTGYRFVLNNGAEIKPYTLFSVDHDLMASNDVIVNNETFDNSRKGTRVNAGVGVNINMTKNLSVGSEVKLSKGKNIDTPITINLGAGYTF